MGVSSLDLAGIRKRCRPFYFMGLTRIKPALGRLPPRLPRANLDGAVDAKQRNIDAPWQRWYRTARWTKLRRAILIRDGLQCQMPGCQRIEGNTSLLVCDHIEPHRGNAEKFWDEANLRTVCKACHDNERQKEEQSSLMQRGQWY